MTCLCKYLTPERAAATGVDISGKVCVFCARKPGVSFPPEPVPDPRAGMCQVRDCPNTAQVEEMCWSHYSSVLTRVSA